MAIELNSAPEIFIANLQPLTGLPEQPLHRLTRIALRNAVDFGQP